MTDISVYMAGPIRDVDDNGRTWRELAKERWSETFEWVDPLDKYDSDEDNVEFISDTADVEESTEGVEYVTPKDIVETDKKMVKEADALFVGWKEVHTTGTPMEVLIGWQLGKPIAVYTDHQPVSPWMEYHADYISQFPGDCVNYLYAQFQDE